MQEWMNKLIHKSIVVVFFSSHARIWGECLTIPSLPALFSSFFFFTVKIRSCTLNPLFRLGSIHSGSASWDDCGRVFPDELHVSSFPDRFPHYACTAAKPANFHFIGSRTYVCLGVTCHSHFWQNDQGLLRATAVSRGWKNRHWIKVRTES